MTAMYRLFYNMLALGLIFGFFLSVYMLNLPEDIVGNLPLLLTINLAIGLFFGFFNYIFVKIILRIFVVKFHHMEEIITGNTPDPLPGVFTSNEIDEIEESVMRISHKVFELKAKNEHASKTRTIIHSNQADDAVRIRN